MNGTLPSGDHLDGGGLLRLLDRDGDAAELEAGARHVAACAACGSELERLGRRSARLSGLMREVDLPADFAHPSMPALRRGRFGGGAGGAGAAAGWRLRAAAAVLLVLLPLAAVAPLRAAVTHWLAARWSQVVELTRAADSAVDEAPSTGVESPPSTLWFALPGEELRLELAGRQRGGTLLLRRSAEREASLQVTGERGTDGVTVSEAAVHIRNLPESTAAIAVGVPVAVRRVVVRIGSEPAVEVDSAALDAGWSLPLSEGMR